MDRAIDSDKNVDRCDVIFLNSSVLSSFFFVHTIWITVYRNLLLHIIPFCVPSKISATNLISKWEGAVGCWHHSARCDQERSASSRTGVVCCSWFDLQELSEISHDGSHGTRMYTLRKWWIFMLNVGTTYISPMDPMGIVDLIQYDELFQSQSGNLLSIQEVVSFHRQAGGDTWQKKRHLKSYVKTMEDLFAVFFSECVFFTLAGA